MTQDIQSLKPSFFRTLQGGLFSAIKTAVIWGSIATLAIGGLALLASTGALGAGIGLSGGAFAGLEGFALFKATALWALPWAMGVTGALGFLTGAQQAHQQQKIGIAEMQQAAIDSQLHLQPGRARHVSFEGPGHPANDKRMEFTQMIEQQRVRQTGRSQGA